MQSSEKIIKCYNDAATNYAAERIDKLSKKHFDRLLLREFASGNKDNGLCADFGCGPLASGRCCHRSTKENDRSQDQSRAIQFDSVFELIFQLKLHHQLYFVLRMI